MALATAEVGITKSSQAKWNRSGGGAAEKLKEGDDVLIPTGIKLEWNSTTTIASIKGEGTYGITGNTAMNFGGTTTVGYLINLPAGTGFTWSGEVSINATNAARLGINVPHSILSCVANKGKYTLESSLVTTGGSIRIQEEADVTAGGNEVSASGFIELTSGKPIFDCKGATVKSNSGVAFTATATIVDSATTKWVLASAASLTLAALSLKGLVEVLANGKIEGNGSIGGLAVNNKGAAAGAGCKLRFGQELTIGELGITSNGTTGSPARLESTEAGKLAKLKLAGTIEQGLVLAVRDIEVEEASTTWYLPEGQDAANGTKTNESNIRIVFAKSGATMERSATESVVLTETTSRVDSSPRSATDSVAVGEAASRIVSQPRSATDTASIAEVAVPVTGHPRTASDTVSVGEASSRIVSQPRPSSDAIAVGEAPVRVLTQPRSAADTVTIGETTTVGRGHSVAASDSISIAENASRIMGLVRPHATAIAVAEVASRVLHRARAASDTIEMVEAWRVEGNVQRKVRFFSRWAASAITRGRIAPPAKLPARFKASAEVDVEQEVVRP